MTWVCTAPRTAMNPQTAWPHEFARSLMWRPAVDVRETDSAYEFTLEVPGFSNDEVNVEAQGNLLTIKGTRKAEACDCSGKWHRRERAYGNFERSFEVPDGFDSEKVQAKLDHGLLHVTLAKREETKPKQIKVTVN